MMMMMMMVTMMMMMMIIIRRSRRRRMSMFLEGLSILNCAEQVQIPKYKHGRHPKQYVSNQSCSDI